MASVRDDAFSFRPGTFSDEDEDGSGEPVPQVSRLIGKFREELRRGLSSADLSDDDHRFARSRRGLQVVPLSPDGSSDEFSPRDGGDSGRRRRSSSRTLGVDPYARAGASDEAWRRGGGRSDTGGSDGDGDFGRNDRRRSSLRNKVDAFRASLDRINVVTHGGCV